MRLRLLQPDGAPLANARVQIGSGDGYNRPGSLQLDAQGRVDVALAPYGGFRVQAKSAAGVDLAAEVGGIDAGAAEGVVDVPLAPRSP